MSTLKYIVCTLAAFAVLAPAPSAGAASPQLQRAAINRPATDMQDVSHFVASDRRVVYALDTPLLSGRSSTHPGHVTTNFHSNVFVVRLTESRFGIGLSKPRLLFRGPKGMQTAFGALNGGWLTYTEAPIDRVGPWTMFARNIGSGKVIVLDSRNREGVPSMEPPPSTDGRTVVWQAFTNVGRQGTSIIRAYDLKSGRRRVLAEGGNPQLRTNWVYDGARVSGRWVVTQKESIGQPRGQIVLIDLRTRRAHGITPPSGANSDPTISGGIVTWMLGARFSNGGHGVGAYSMRTGRERRFPGSNIGLPQAFGARYVAFGTGQTTTIKLYDSRTGRLRVLAQGWGTGYTIRAGGQTLIYEKGERCKPNDPMFAICPSKLIVVRLP